MFSFLRRNKLSSTESVDIVEQMVYEYLKPLGFRKFGRTLHRFVDTDISQVIQFQNGCPQKGIFNLLWVNLGIRVPECQERQFERKEPAKKYYHEHECNIRTSLERLEDGTKEPYDLEEDPEKIAKDVLRRIQEYVLPVFAVLNSRDAILAHRREYPIFDSMNCHQILLEEAMIYGRRGERELARERFLEYYQMQLKEYYEVLEHGTKHYLQKGEKLVYRNRRTEQTETIVAQKSGEVVLYDPNVAHLAYLGDLAKQLDVLLPNNPAEILLKSSDYTCVLCNDKKLYTSTFRGVRPLVQWLEEGAEVTGFFAADKVIGKATAFLYVLLGVKEVYAHAISESALGVLQEYGIDVKYKTLVEYIINRKGDGMCPFEAAVQDIRAPQAAYERIKAKMKEFSMVK